LMTRLQATAAAAAAGFGNLAAAKQQQQQPAVGGVLYACELAGLPDLLQALQQWLDDANQQQQQQQHQQQQQQQDGDAKRRTRGVEAVAAAAGAAAAAAGVPAGLDDPAGGFEKCYFVSCNAVVVLPVIIACCLVAPYGIAGLASSLMCER
jgi:hypothetical protein